MNIDISKAQFTSRIGNIIKRYRKERGMTLRDLAKRADCTGSYIALVEKGNNPPNSWILFLLSKALYVPITAFFGDDNIELNTIKDPLLSNKEFEPYLALAKEAYFKGLSANDLNKVIKIVSRWRVVPNILKNYVYNFCV